MGMPDKLLLHLQEEGGIQSLPVETATAQENLKYVTHQMMELI